MTVAIIGLLIGAAIGARFNVVVVIPAIGLALLGTAGAGIVHGDPIGSVGLTMVLIATTLQLGYLAGVVLRAVLLSVRMSNARGTVPHTPSRFIGAAPP